MKRKNVTAKDIADTLSIAPENLSIWRVNQSIPDKHFKPLVRVLGIPKKSVIKALKKDIAETFK
jgi:hypothetical protein